MGHAANTPRRVERSPRLLRLSPLRPSLAGYWGLTVIVGWASFAAAGCSRNKRVVELDTYFSYNVAEVPVWFEDPEIVRGVAESEVLVRRGRPDYIRFWWRRDGALITSSDLSGKHHRVPQELTLINKSWVYLGEDEEVVFVNEGRSYKTEPLTETLKLVCEYGDPGDKSPPIYRDGARRETWLWYDHGFLVELRDGKVVDKKYFPASGAGTYRLK